MPRYKLNGQERTLAFQAIGALEKELMGIAQRMVALGLMTMQVETWQGRCELVRKALSSPATDMVELTTETRGTLRTALELLKSKVEKVKEAQEKLLIEPDDTKERVSAIDWLCDTLRGQGVLFDEGGVSATAGADGGIGEVTISMPGEEPVTLTGEQFDRVADRLSQ